MFGVLNLTIASVDENSFIRFKVQFCICRDLHGTFKEYASSCMSGNEIKNIDNVKQGKY